MRIPRHWRITVPHAIVAVWVLLILLAGHANAQAVRFDTVVDTTSPQCASGKICPLNVIPGSIVSVCGGSVTTLTSCLASPATTYTNSGAGTPCATTAQLTPATGGACLSTADNQGGAGFWALPGQYNYFIRVPATAGGGTYGPYPINVGASAGCPLGATCDASYSTLAAACTAAGTGTLYITRTWILTTQSLACNIEALANGIIKPGSGQTISLTKSFHGSLTQHFDLSAGGTFNLSAATFATLYPEWFGAKCFGVDDTTAIQNTFDIGSPSSKITFNCASTINDTIIVKFPGNTSRGGLTIEGAGYTATSSDASIGNSLIAGASMSGKPMIKFYAENTTSHNFGVDCNHIAQTGVVFIANVASIHNAIAASRCVGDGVQLNVLAGEQVTGLDTVMSGSTSTFRVNKSVLEGQTLDDATCNVLVLDIGRSTQERMGFSVNLSTNVVTPDSPYTQTHTTPFPSVCDGNDNEMVFNQPRYQSNGGWGFDIVHDPGNDTNNIIVRDPFAGGNALGGQIWSGFANALYGGHYEGNRGPANQLGDINGGGAVELNGRLTFKMVIHPVQDIEENPSAFNSVSAICSQQSNIVYSLRSELTLGLSNRIITGATAASTVAFTATIVPIGGQVVITGGTGNWAAVNGTWTATKLSDTTFSIPVNSTTFGAVTGTLKFRTACIQYAGLGGTVDMGQGRDQDGSGFPEYSWTGVFGRIALNPNDSGLYFYDTDGVLTCQLTQNGTTFNFGTCLPGVTTTLSFTPVVSFGGGSTGITYAGQFGTAYQIGKIVFVWGRVDLSSKGSSTGNAVIGGLPATINAAAGGTLGFFDSVTSVAGTPILYGVSGGTSVSLFQTSGGTGMANLTNANFTNSTSIIFSMTYSTP